MRVTAACIFLFALLVVSSPGQDNSAASVASLRQRAESGDARAQFELGRAYEDGKGVAQDDTRAAEWFRKAADQGNAQAQNSLGVMYALGRGVSRDREEAIRWYKKAAKQGQAEAFYNVGIAYYNGEGVAEDLQAAYAWMFVAKSTGDAQAAEALARMAGELKTQLVYTKFKLAEMYEKGDEIPRDIDKAVSLYQEVASGDPHSAAAPFKLCQLYVEGKIVAQDYVQGKSWCAQAAKRGSSASYLVLGRLAEMGLGGPTDLKAAADWYQNAAIFNLRDGFMFSGELKLKSGSHDDQKSAYYWFYLAQRVKIPEADAKLQEAASHLNKKEIAEQQKKANEWLHTPAWEKMKKLKR
ncbi:MAG: tetratricopeptide repeat protein [Candidatus Angelobacter sp.]